MQHRLFHRVLFTAKSAVTLDDVTFQGQIENISLNGALVNFEKKDVIVRGGDTCFLSIYPEGESNPLRIITEVVHERHGMVGVKFVALDTDTRLRLYQLVEKAAAEPEKVRSEWCRLNGYLADYFMPEKPLH